MAAADGHDDGFEFTEEVFDDNCTHKFTQLFTNDLRRLLHWSPHLNLLSEEGTSAVDWHQTALVGLKAGRERMNSCKGRLVVCIGQRPFPFDIDHVYKSRSKSTSAVLGGARTNATALVEAFKTVTIPSSLAELAERHQRIASALDEAAKSDCARCLTQTVGHSEQFLALDPEFKSLVRAAVTQAKDGCEGDVTAVVLDVASYPNDTCEYCAYVLSAMFQHACSACDLPANCIEGVRVSGKEADGASFTAPGELDVLVRIASRETKVAEEGATRDIETLLRQGRVAQWTPVANETAEAPSGGAASASASAASAPVAPGKRRRG